MIPPNTTTVKGLPVTLQSSTYLECRVDGHNKFWRIELVKFNDQVNKWAVVATWGRIGTRGQFNEKTFMTLRSAEVYSDQRVRDKLAKGYVTAMPQVQPPENPKAAIAALPESVWDVL